MIHGRHLVIFSGTKANTGSNYHNLIPGQTGPQTLLINKNIELEFFY